MYPFLVEVGAGWVLGVANLHTAWRTEGKSLEVGVRGAVMGSETRGVGGEGEVGVFS